MRKSVVIILAVLFVFSLTPVALAHSSGDVYIVGNSGWVSDGYHGQYWSGDFGDRVVVDWDSYYDHVRVLGSYYDLRYDRDSDWYDWDRYHDDVDGEWYHYKDDNGVTRYFFDDVDDNGWNYHSYVDEYGNTQYSRTKVVSN